MTVRDSLLGACLVLPLGAWGRAALAVGAAGAQAITIPPGAAVSILPGALARWGRRRRPRLRCLAGDPRLLMVAERDPMVRDLMGELDVPFAHPMWPMAADRGQVWRDTPPVRRQAPGLCPVTY
jgi:hypothetical protein